LSLLYHSLPHSSHCSFLTCCKNHINLVQLLDWTYALFPHVRVYEYAWFYMSTLWIIVPFKSVPYFLEILLVLSHSTSEHIIYILQF
jgi:hypothetical protein